MNPWKMSQYKPGQTVNCRVTSQEPGGYAVNIFKDNVPGFLPTDHKHKIGEEVLAQFVAVANNRVLLQSLYSTSSAANARSSQRMPTVDWQEQLRTGVAPPMTGPDGQPADPQGYDRPPEEAAFAVWAADKKIKYKLKRAIDLILPSIGNQNSQSKFKMSDTGLSSPDEALQWLLTDLEGGMRTGCVKAFSEQKLSRSAVLLYKGRAVGCVYGNKNLSEPLGTEPALRMMLEDLVTPDAQVLIYDLPEDVTLAMSALFLGYRVSREDGLDARSYMDYIMSWLNEKTQTACLAFTLFGSNMCLAFVHKGRYAGAFYVEDQKYSPDPSYLQDLLGQDPQAQVEASILPPELTSTSVRYGFSLSMSRPRT